MIANDDRKRVIFLDIDGVLNDKIPNSNGYCGIDRQPLYRLCLFLEENRDINIVLSSSWRYLILNKCMELSGFECMLIAFGASYEAINGRICGITECDEFSVDSSLYSTQYLSDNGSIIRTKQILDYIGKYNITDYVVLDDMSLNFRENFVQTDGNIGLIDSDIDKMLEMFVRQDIANKERMLCDE